MRAKCTVFLATYGGDAHAGFRVAQCLRHHYKDGVKVVVPSYCKSAGTLIVIGADKLAIGDMGELGPLDVQVSKPTEILERGSGLDYTQALMVAFTHAQRAFGESLLEMRRRFRFSTKMAGELASQLACGVVEPLYAQIDPNRIGEMQRAIQIALEYGQRLDDQGGNLLEGALDTLVADYPSHSFVIDRMEARCLFKTVQPPSDVEQTVCTTLWNVVGDQASPGVCVLLTPTSHDQAKAQERIDAQGPANGVGAVGGQTSACAVDASGPHGGRR